MDDATLKEKCQKADQFINLLKIAKATYEIAKNVHENNVKFLWLVAISFAATSVLAFTYDHISVTAFIVFMLTASCLAGVTLIEKQRHNDSISKMDSKFAPELNKTQHYLFENKDARRFVETLDSHTTINRLDLLSEMIICELAGTIFEKINDANVCQMSHNEILVIIRNPSVGPQKDTLSKRAEHVTSSLTEIQKKFDIAVVRTGSEVFARAKEGGRALEEAYVHKYEILGKEFIVKII